MYIACSLLQIIDLLREVAFILEELFVLYFDFISFFIKLHSSQC